MREQWKDIVGYKGYYQVSNLGSVKSMNRTICNNGITRTLNGHTLAINNRGYVSLYRDGKVRLRNVSRLVISSFHKSSGMPVVYKDGDKTNRSLRNLRYRGEEKETLMYRAYLEVKETIEEVTQYQYLKSMLRGLLRDLLSKFFSRYKNKA